jgi:D-alanyl-D-alanine carboxypeptidase
LEDLACRAGRFSVIVVSDEYGRSSAACGEDASGHTVAVDDAFPIWSATKMLTAATVLSLVDKGLVELDAPVATYVDFDFDEAITVRHLLSHKSGLAEGDPWSCDADATLEAMTSIAAKGPIREPGTPTYSTTGFMFTSLIMASATNMDAAAVFHEEVSQTLGMTDTYFMATEEGPTPRGGAYGDGDTCPGTTRTLGTGGDIVSTPADLERFIVGLFDGDLLSAESLSTMLDMQSSVYGLPYGLGVAEIESPDGSERSLFGHWGTTNSFEAGVVHDPESHTTIVLFLAGGNYQTMLWDIADWAVETTDRDE